MTRTDMKTRLINGLPLLAKKFMCPVFLNLRNSSSFGPKNLYKFKLGAQAHFEALERTWIVMII